MKKLVLAVLIFVSSSSGFAESKKVPLLLPRTTASDVYSDGPYDSKNKPLYFGVELGAVGRTDGTAGTVAGFQIPLGGRFYALFPLSSRWAVKPSLGYFRTGQSLAGVSVTEQDIEPGVTLEYTVSRSHSFQWWLGGVDRLEILLSTISVLNSSGTGFPALRDRLGPATGVAFRMAKDVNLTVDTEVAASVTLPVRFYPAATIGVLYRWK